MSFSTYNKGKLGEDAASVFLENKGYKILERNYRRENCEIDIIADDRGTIVFCEVKSARTCRFGPATSWVTPVKIKKLSRAAEAYIMEKEVQNCALRFDVIGIEHAVGEIEITHIIDAFQVSEEC